MKRIALLVIAAACSSGAQAQNRLEDVLRNPWVQQLLGQKLPDVKLDALKTDAQLCAGAPFRAANVARCQAADQAARVAAMPQELRVMMANPATAAPMRQLCLANVQVATSNALCVELAKGDAGLGTQIEALRLEEQNRQYQQAAGDQRP